MKSFRLFFTLVLAVTAAVLAVRHRSLRELQAEQTHLRQQIEQGTNLPAAAAQTKAVQLAPDNAVLPASERSELFRLRGEVGVLRGELAQETNQLAKGAQRTTPPRSAAEADEPIVSKQEALIKMNRGKQWMLALFMHAQENGGRLPATLADASKFAGTLEGSDDFELVGNGDLQSIKAPNQAIVLREKQPWKSTNGLWSRGYAFADGHVEIASSPTMDFTDWEQRKRAQANAVPNQ